MNEIGLYCHIPFCASTCDFCSFYQEKPERLVLNKYIDAMKTEFLNLPSNININTIFWGGGTPTLLSAKHLDELGSSLLRTVNYGFNEWTVEMAPSTVKRDKLKVLKELGVNRVSLGVQSFNQCMLDKLGRLHNLNHIYAAWDIIKSFDFKETNIDLIFAIPGQNIEDFYNDLNEFSKFESSHLSTYCLTFEEDTLLYLKLLKGEIIRDKDEEYDFYQKSWKMIEDIGFKQYEVSNFAKSKESRCLHNMNVWGMGEWIGCGPSAASQYNYRRFVRPKSLDKWINSIDEKIIPEEEVLLLESKDLFFDSLTYGLRMTDGIDLNCLKNKHSVSCDGINQKIGKLKDEGYMIISDGNIKLTKEGLIKVDSISEYLINS